MWNKNLKTTRSSVSFRFNYYKYGDDVGQLRWMQGGRAAEREGGGVDTRQSIVKGYKKSACSGGM